MKKTIAILALAALGITAANAGVRFGINFGIPVPAPVVVQPPMPAPIVEAAPVARCRVTSGWEGAGDGATTIGAGLVVARWRRPT
jgi:hypothetical protein